MPNKSDNNALVVAGGVALAAGLSYYMTKKDPPIDPIYDFDNQSVEIDPVEHIRVNTSRKDKPLIEYRQPDVRTLYDVLPKGKEVSNDGPCLGMRDGPGKGPYNWIKYSDVIEQTKAIGSAIVNNGIESNNSTHIGIYSANRNEWIIAEHACYSFSFPVVSLYDSYGKDSIKYILNHAEIKAIFIDNFARLMNTLEVIDSLPHLSLIVYFDKLNPAQLDKLNKFSDQRVKIVSFDQLLEEGRRNNRRPIPPKPSDVATICYTSGTTGAPKGAMITHGNIISNEAAINEVLFKKHLNLSEFDPPMVHISFLPLAHMLERQSTILVFLAGGKLGFMSGDLLSLVDDIKELKPNNLPMVPRLLNRVFNSVMNQVKSSPAKMFLMNKAIAAKEEDRKRGIYRKNTIWDKLVFNKIRAGFGGNVCRIATGSAPISDEVLIFAKAAFGCPIPEGYGQTEATCSITFSHPLDPSLGHCGPPVSCYMVKLVDVPDMGYFSNDNKGEICAKGPSMFKGYLKDEEKTAETIDKDGWLHTGDIGMWLPNGTLKIIDRKKNLFKLSQGEYISPDKIENVYLRSQFIAQILIEGNPLKDFIVAIVVPDFVYLQEYCKKINIQGTNEELCQNKKIKSIILEDLNKFGKQANLMSYEQVRNIYLYHEMFSLENGLATPTMKLKRFDIRKKFKDVIEQLYNQVPVKSKI